jgi:peptidase MA superfamily protein
MLNRRVSLLLLMLGCVVLPWMSFSVPMTHAQTRSQAITVQARSYAVHFPSSIDFYATVSDSISPLQRANLVLNLGTQHDQELQTVQVPQGQKNATLHWHEDTSGSHFLPAGTPVSYSWQIWDTIGNTLVDLSQSLTTIDTRFQWQHANRGQLQVNWYNRSQSFGQMLLKQVTTSIDHITTVLGSGLKHPINLWVYSSDTDFHGSLEPGAYEWVGGEAFPDLHEASIVVTDASDETLLRDMPHELTHLVFHQLIGNGNYPPVWFDEGLAVYNQLFHEPDMLTRFNQALSTNTLLRLDDLTMTFPADSDQAYLAYAQSWQLLTYMYNTFGHAKMTQLIQNLGIATNDFDSALQKSIGEDHLHLENQWHVALDQPAVLSNADLTPTPTITNSPASSVGTSQSGSNIALWIFAGLGAIILLEGCIVAFWLAHKKRLRSAQIVPVPPVSPQSPTGWSQIPITPPANWPAGYAQGTLPSTGANMSGQSTFYPSQHSREYVQVPVPWRAPQE